jgi:glutamyl/glutaminyl-tRNA synthetase
MRALAEAVGLSAAKLIHPTRLAVTGWSSGPGLFELVSVLGKQTAVRRLRKAAAAIEKHAEEPAQDA